MSSEQSVSKRLNFSPASTNRRMVEPKWRMVEPVERFPSHVHVTAVRERQVGDVTQVIERVMVQPTSAYEYPGYRVLEVRDGKATIMRVFGYLKDARSYCDKRA